MVEAERPYYAFIKETVTYYDLEALIAEDDSHLLVVESEGKIIGSGYAQIRDSGTSYTYETLCYLGFIYLEPGHRGKAIGQTMLELLKDWGIAKGLAHFHLDVYADNESAIRAYEKAGFKKLTVKMELIV